MNRRAFTTLLGGAAAWPFAAGAQQPARLPTIGFLGTTTASAWRSWTAAFVERLRELGWIEGSNVAVEYRWAEAHNERFAAIASEFVRLKVDVIVTGGNAALAVKQTTSVIPIIFVLAVDPVRMGLVASLARPSGNVTGLSNQQTDAPGKRVEILRETVPDLRRLAIMANVEFSEALLEMREVQAIAKGQSLDVITSEIRGPEDIPIAFATVRGQAKPGDIPVEQPTKFDLIVNLKTAKAIGLAIPDRIIALANEVIE
jgi:putative ABC transport system substrate-binding protein